MTEFEYPGNNEDINFDKMFFSVTSIFIIQRTCRIFFEAEHNYREFSIIRYLILRTFDIRHQFSGTGYVIIPLDAFHPDFRQFDIRHPSLF